MASKYAHPETLVDTAWVAEVATRLRCATLGLSTLKAAIKKYRRTLLRTENTLT